MSHLPRAKASTLAFSSILAVAAAFALTSSASLTSDAPLKPAVITGEDWTELTLSDFINVNGDETTWKEVDGEIHCTGRPIGGARSQEMYENFELVLEWKHTVAAGNSGVFVWCPESAFTDLQPGSLPRSGIEVQVLDLAYETRHLEKNGKHSDWFTSHGDVFPVGDSKMKPFTPEIDYQAEDGSRYHVGTKSGVRSFPTKRLSNDVGEWNHYYIRAINGEVRLWVNGEEVNGGNGCEPARGYLALEAEGAPVVFRNLRVRRLP